MLQCISHIKSFKLIKYVFTYIHTYIHKIIMIDNSTKNNKNIKLVPLVMTVLIESNISVNNDTHIYYNNINGIRIGLSLNVGF